MNGWLRTIAIIISCMTIAVGPFAARGDDEKAQLPLATKEAVDFVRDVQPIFRRACLQCHGEIKQKGAYRLDAREIALHAGDSYAPSIIPGKSAESPLIQFVAGTGDLLMPPEGERLSAKEIGILRAWIDNGADWPDSASVQVKDKGDLWSLKPLVRPTVPKAGEGQSTANAIDRFVLAKLAEHQFSPSPAADRRTLIRRVYFDLIGLPPTPETVNAFVADTDNAAYEKLIDRLLDSPQYGERWARHWMDAAHFAETHGHDQDRIRENAWPYRDYLIAALNADRPYSRFIQEQLAADALFPNEPWLTPALGFLAAGPWDESSLRDIREDTLDRQIARYLDRDDMLTNVIGNICSLTVQCARCHDHKFDPIEQRDYYALQAVFSGVERANRKFDADPAVQRQRQILTARKSDLENLVPSITDELLSLQVQGRVADWEQRRAVNIPKWVTIEIEAMESSDGVTLTRLSDGSILASGAKPEKDTVAIRSRLLSSKTPVNGGADPQAVTAIRLDVLTDDSLPNHGPGRADNGNLHLSEFEVYLDGKPQPLALVNPIADFNQSSWEITKSIDQNIDTAWGIHPKEGSAHHAIFELKTPIQLPNLGDGSSDAPTRLRIVQKQLHGRSHLIGRFRLSMTDAKPPFLLETLPDAVTAAFAVPAAQRTTAQQIELGRFVELESVSQQVAALPQRSLVYAAAADFDPDGSMHPPKGPRPIHILHRGDIRNPRAESLPGALACVPGPSPRFEIPTGAQESARRAALALWLTDHDNLLTWRSIVNRVWHYHFGRGLVSTLNDFGHMGDSPTNPELLDWLAVEFRDGGQSLKSLHRLILTSATYKQTCEITRSGVTPTTNPAQDPRTTNDADNHLLWRMNRTRMDAESVRDAILQISGLLDSRMGGPSDRQFDLKPGIHVTPMVDYSKFDPNNDLGRRRSVYRFLFRTLPDPFMDSLDCPSGDQITPVRSNSVTVQQALALWNDVFVATYSERIAERIAQEVQNDKSKSADKESSIELQIERAVSLIFCRQPTPNELQDFGLYVDRHGMANLCRLLLNSNEFLFIN